MNSLKLREMNRIANLVIAAGISKGSSAFFKIFNNACEAKAILTWKEMEKLIGDCEALIPLFDVTRFDGGSIKEN